MVSEGLPPSTARVDDSELWLAAASGDEGAFAALFERHVRAVWNHAYRLTGSWADAEDITSLTFLTAWNKRTQVTLVRASALPWLCTVVGNLARTERRRFSRRNNALSRLPDVGEQPDHAEKVAGKVDDERRLKAVLSAVRRLPEAERLAVELCVLGDVAVPDAAQVLGVAEGSVRARLSRARTRLRTRMLCEGGDPR